jgi:hypothetical protein
VPVRRDRTLEMLSIQSTAGYRFRAKMVEPAALALVLAMVGVFGVLATPCSSGSARLRADGARRQQRLA